MSRFPQIRPTVVALGVCAILAAGATVGSASPEPSLPAFPGAQGFGALATGGRGGDVIVVSTLEGYGPGSLGEALDPPECRPRIVVFAVSGTIEGMFDLTCGDITIAGQTAPGAGITIRGGIDGFGADPGGNIIIRHLRLRPPEPEPGKGGFHDALQLSNNPVAIIDHVSASWGADEVVDFFEGTSDITVQWSTIETARTEGHPDGQHNYAFIAGPEVSNVSIHHTLFAHHRARCPALSAGPAEVVNNVMYNCKDGFVHHNPAEGEFLIQGNVFRRGVDGDEMVPILLDDEEPGGTGYAFVQNLIDDPDVFVGVVDNPFVEPLAHPTFEYSLDFAEDVTDEPYSFETSTRVPVSVHPVEAALDVVLANAGAFPRDAVTARTISDVENRSGTWGEGVDEPRDLLEGLIASEPPPDADGDGMADEWEREQGLDPNDPDDPDTVMGTGYTAIEDYVNGLADLLVASAPSAPPDTGVDLDGDDSAASDSDSGDVAGRSDNGTAPASEAASSDSDSDLLAVIALIVAVVALALSAMAFGRTGGLRSAGRSTSPGNSDSPS